MPFLWPSEVRSLARRALAQANSNLSPANRVHVRKRVGKPNQTLKSRRRDTARTSLDTLETTVLETRRNLTPARTAYRKQLSDDLMSCASTASEVERVERLKDCSCDWYVARNRDGLLTITRRCRQRLCPECQRLRSAKYRRHYADRLSKYKAPKLLTLTIKTQPNPLGDEVTRVLKCFNRLRRTAVWKQLVARGIYVLEITRNKQTRGWHVHIHVMLDAKFIPQDWLADTWEQITGDSRIVDIRAADTGTARYLAAYVSKSVRANLEAFEQWPVFYELHGRRLSGTFGDEPPINDESETDESLEVLGRLDDIIDRAMSGDRWAQDVVAELLTPRNDDAPPDKHG